MVGGVPRTPEVEAVACVRVESGGARRWPPRTEEEEEEGEAIAAGEGRSTAARGRAIAADCTRRCQPRRLPHWAATGPPAAGAGSISQR